MAYHLLSEIDVEGKQAFCFACDGVVSIRPNGYRDGIKKWVCAQVRGVGIRTNEPGTTGQKIVKPSGKIPVTGFDIPCEICGRVSTARDHCYKRNAWRGALCTNCNLGLAKLEDIEWVKKAKLYLALHEARLSWLEQGRDLEREQLA